MSTEVKTERGFTIVRHLEAPRELVFQAWTDPDLLQWFANPGHTQSHPITVDLRVGGTWRLSMVEDENRSYTTGGIYREIVPPEKLVYSWGAVDGWPRIDPTKPDDVPVVTITLNDVGGVTEMIAHIGLADHLSDEQVEEWFALGIAAGWRDTIDRLSPFLSATNR